MHYLKVAVGVLFGIAVFLFLDYALPSKNTVRITNTYNRLTSVTPSNAGWPMMSVVPIGA